jgi:hypothetical protein
MLMKPVFSAMPANNTDDTKDSKSVFVKTTGHEKLRTVMLSVLADRRRLKQFLILKRKTFQKKNFLLKLYLNLMRKDG